MVRDTEIYRGYTIEINQEEHAENPFENWDCNLPLMWNSGRNNGEDYSKGDINNFLSNVLTDGQIIRHQKRLLEALEIDCDEDTPREEKIDYIRDEIQNTSSYYGLSEVCELAKIPSLSTSRSGYIQGDYTEIFTCWTPEFEKLTGCSKKQISDSKTELEGNADLFGYWAFGDVYWFNIEEADDSCGGFYGDDYEKSGLLEHAKNSIDCHIENVKEKRYAKLKKLIKNKVPVIYRAKQIEQFHLI